MRHVAARNPGRNGLPLFPLLWCWTDCSGFPFDDADRHAQSSRKGCFAATGKLCSGENRKNHISGALIDISAVAIGKNARNHLAVIQRGDQFVASELFLLALVDSKGEAGDIARTHGLSRKSLEAAIAAEDSDRLRFDCSTSVEMLHKIMQVANGIIHGTTHVMQQTEIDDYMGR